MRHYYRFMELEPVMELEEDSVGNESPTSSTGSPSFSPPPDVWAQLSGKEYQDSAYNLLLQDHVELQRAYRLLEVQFRNSETRAARDLTDSAIHVRHLKDTLKEVILTQETDKLLAMKEDLQRSKEREEKLKAEAYDLREQNELLEFRILELEECHENSSLRGATHETCDVGTDMSDDVILFRKTSPLIERQRTEDVRTCENTLDAPDSCLPVAYELGNPNQCRSDAETTSSICREGDQILESTITQSSDKHGNMTGQSRTTDLRQSVANDQPNEQKRLKTTEEGLWMKPIAIATEVSTRPEIIEPLTNFSSESISCTLCRSASRRRSFPCSLIDDDGVKNQKETLKKSKSDGAIQNMNIEVSDFETRIVESTRSWKLDAVNKDILINDTKINDIKIRKRSNMNCMRKLHDFVDAELSLQTRELSQNSKTSNLLNECSSKRDEQLLKMLKAIHDILMETRIEVECTNSELREEVVTLESTVISLTQERLERRNSLSEGDDEGVKKLRDLFSRSSSLSSSDECNCCSQQLRPTLEDVISKLQQLTDLVLNKELSKSSHVIVNEESDIKSRAYLLNNDPIEKNEIELPSAVIFGEEKQSSKELEICANTTETHNIEIVEDSKTNEQIGSEITEIALQSKDFFVDVDIRASEVVEAINKDVLIMREIPTSLNIIPIEMPTETLSCNSDSAEKKTYGGQSDCRDRDHYSKSTYKCN